MADRRAIRDSFMSLLEGLSGSYTVTYGDGTTDTITLDQDDIKLQDPESIESLPQLVYNDSYNRVYYNDVGLGPDKVELDSSGNVVEERWREYINASFTIHVRASNELHKEPIYEAARREFAKFQFGAWSLNDIHPDVQKIRVEDADSNDAGTTEQRIRGDTLTVQIEFYREYVFDTTNIAQINHEVDLDLDDATQGLIYTTT